MPRALYDTDRERAERKRGDLLDARENGGTYLELGPSGAVTYSEWTCPWCLRTLTNTHATGKPSTHRLSCDERPHPDQQELPAFAGGDP